MSEPNRVVVRKCPGCTRMVTVFVADDDRPIRCRWCSWVGPFDELVDFEREPLPELSAVDYANDRAVADGFELDGGF